MPRTRTSLVPLALATGLLLAGAAPAGAAPVVQGAILQHWTALGGPAGLLGAPLTDELATPTRYGRFSVFQHGSIYWSPATGAWEVHGLIRDRWAALGWENGLLGFPTSDEHGLARDAGAFSRFEGGHVYWSPASGAHEVHGAIWQAYAALGWEAGLLGYPVTDEQRTGRGAVSTFQGGAVHWSPATGAHEVHGAVRAKWDAIGGELSVLGLPVDDEQAMPGGRASDFEHGRIEWTAAGGAVVTRFRGIVSSADTAHDRMTVDDVQQTVAWSADDEFAVVPAGGDVPVDVGQREFEERLDAALAGVTAPPGVTVDLGRAPGQTSRFVLHEASAPGLAR